MESGYSIKRVSELLDCSTQNIYRQKQDLISKGYWEQSETGSHYITENGINYLREKRIETIKASNQDFKQVANNNLQSVATPVLTDNTELIAVLKKQIEDLKEENTYWKKKYEYKDQELTKANEHLQNMNTTVFQKLLATEEQNRKQEEETKKGFFRKLFH